MDLFSIWTQYSVFHQIVLLLFVFSFMLEMRKWRQDYSPLLDYPEPRNKPLIGLPCSVIVAGKNEADNIKRFLPKLLEQEYPAYEIIWVNDHSTDDSWEVLQSFRDSRLRSFQAPADGKGKKEALRFGIQKAQYEHLLFLDADCYPASSRWIQQLMNAFSENKSMVLGYSAFEKRPGLLNQIIRYETLLYGIQYLAAAARNKPYMGVGRNMAYTKSLFSNSSQFNKNQDILSGDDDLFVNEMADKIQVGIALGPDALTISLPEENTMRYWRQKRRHLQAGTRYRLADRLQLAAAGFSLFLFNATFLLLLIRGQNLLLIFVSLGLKHLVQGFYLLQIAKRLRDKDMWWKSIGLEALSIFLLTCIGVSTWIWKVRKWK